MCLRFGQGAWGGRLFLRGGGSISSFQEFFASAEKIFILGGWALVYNSMRFEIFLLFPNFLDPKSSVTPQLGYTTFIINNQASFHLW